MEKNKYTFYTSVKLAYEEQVNSCVTNYEDDEIEERFDYDEIEEYVLYHYDLFVRGTFFDTYLIRIDKDATKAYIEQSLNDDVKNILKISSTDDYIQFTIDNANIVPELINKYIDYKKYVDKKKSDENE